MQLQSDRSHRLDEIKTQFRAREGYYRLMNSPDYSQRSQRAMGLSTGTANSNSSTAMHEKTCIKISLVTVNEQVDSMTNVKQLQQFKPSSVSGNNRPIKVNQRVKRSRDMKICFNVGKELFVYNYDGVRTGPDASNPIYKRFYKGSSPTCHDFNQTTASSGSISLLVGFAHGQVQLIDLNGCDDQDTRREFNTDRLIDRTRVTCLKWLPGSSSLFLVSHASGHLYLYKDDLPCGPMAPIYQLHKQSDGVTVYTCKTKTTRNPIYKWSIGSNLPVDNSCLNSTFGSSSSLFNLENESCSLNEFVFSPCAKYLACVSQDGFLRVYCYDTMELVGRARSYYGGFTCVCWSPDGKYVVTGGEDDLITVWSFIERRVVARGVGHKSWVSAVAFDSYYAGYNSSNSDVDNYDDDDEDDKEFGSHDLEGDDDDDDIEDFNVRSKNNQRSLENDSRSPTNRSNHILNNNYAGSNLESASRGPSPSITTYRFGSVGQDTQLCLWDLSDDLLQQPVAKSKMNTMSGSNSISNLSPTTSNQNNLLEDNKDLNAFSGQMKTDIPSDFSAHRDANNVRATNNNASASTSGGLLSSKGGAFTKTFSLVGKRDKRYFARGVEKNTNSKGFTNLNIGDRLVEDPIRLLGSPICPRMNEVPIIEPTVCKKISFERLTSLIFCRGGFITSCQDGYVFSWARPSRKTLNISPGQSNEELRVIDVGTSSAV